MIEPRRQFLRLAASAVLMPGTVSFADTYPSHPVRLVVGFPPGLTPDIVGRIVAQGLSAKIGQQCFVDNRPGAASNIGAEFALRSPADGYTLFVVTIANAINATLYPGLNFDLVRDMDPVIATFQAPNVLVVTPSFPAKTVPEFIEYAKTKPGQVNYASPGHGSAANVAAELFKIMAQIDLVHVPYRGSYVPDVLAGEVPVTFAPIPTVIQFIRAGKLRALAVTSTNRSNTLPDIPTVSEFLPGYDATVWHGVGAPKNTPPNIIVMLNEALNKLLAESAIKTRFADVGGIALGGSPVDFGKFVSAETEKWAKVIGAANIKPE
ncbi:MAG TPA: tripartite tricarboxylate transporter substrate binding protein [Xanthobacteraceae bacterium]|jgi:tripartite-type tricarboxylate transporter receptor subunit TctC|nr:tripartite tricarboxylate transporter substrate binding protein [Xanthobacteraceae bacterium]